MLKRVECIIYENNEEKSIELLGPIRVEENNKVCLETYQYYVNIAEYIANGLEYDLLIDGNKVLLLYEKGKYAYLERK